MNNPVMSANAASQPPCGRCLPFGVTAVRNYSKSLMICLYFMLVCPIAGADIKVTDDSGQQLSLQQPARRIVSLAPHITEQLFAVGAGEQVVGVSAYSDFPAAANTIQRIGDGGGLDIEAIVALQPDLVVAWQSGNPAAQIARLQALGLTVFISEPGELGEVVTTLQRLGELAGSEEVAQAVIERFNRRLAGLRARHKDKAPVSVFYQVWDTPLMTINGDHLISDVIRLCGGVNVFSGLSQLAPQIGIESVLTRNPRVIIAADRGPVGGDVLTGWWRWSNMSAVRDGNLFTVPGDALVRHTPRILDGAERVCKILDQVRKRDL